MQTIYEFVRKQRDEYRSQTIEITEGYDFSQYETLRTIELYHNSIIDKNFSIWMFLLVVNIILLLAGRHSVMYFCFIAFGLVDTSHNTDCASCD
jgi:hypothetical protein